MKLRLQIPDGVRFGLLVVLCHLWSVRPAAAGGTWAQLASAPPVGVNNCMLLSDGTVLGMNGAGQCVQLTPDSHGSYINGTWSTLAMMNNSRLFFSSQLLTNGSLWVAGGEDGSGGNSAELYTPLNNVWTLIPPPASGYPDFSDSISEILPNGNPLVCPVYTSTSCLIYNVGLNSWQTAASCRASQDEADWVKLPSDNIVTIDAFSQNSEHYIPSQNTWVVDGSLPVSLFDSSLGELGSGHLLPNGEVFYIGSTTNTAIYTPGATVTSAGSWVAGPTIPDGLGAPDAPAAMMVNGKILCCLGPSATYNGPSSFYEYDYTVNAFMQVSAPGGGSTLNNTAPFGTSMIDLPDGTVLFMDGQNTGTLYVYTPDGTPLAAGQPVINSIAENADGSYQLSGTGLNGISEGAAYGDDEQMSGNYPLVRLTNNLSGNVYYARTYNWNSTSVQTGSRVVTTDFTLPQNLPAGTYSLVVTAVGNASAPQTFTYAPPSVPTGISAASGSNAFVNLQWNMSAGATTYDVKRAASISGYFATIATVSGTNYTDAGLTNGLVYYYKVAAVGSNGPSSDSAAVSGVPFGPPPAPGGLTANGGEDAMVQIAWYPSYGATNYNLQRSTNSGGPYVTIASLSGTHFTDTAVINLTTYYYVVSAVGNEGGSQDSAEVSATPLAPLIATWFKADAITGHSSGSTILVWVDSSGHGYSATQATSAERPTYVTGAMNGLPVVRFNSAASTFMSFSRSIQTDFTMLIVFQSSQNNQGAGTAFYQGAGLVNGDQPSTVNDFGSALNANGQIIVGTGNPDTSVNSGNGFNNGLPHVATFKRTRSTGAIELYVDGMEVAAGIGGDNSLTAPPTLDLGAVPSGGGFFSGDLAEVKIYNSALDDADRLAQEASLIQKWGVSLPAAPTGLTAVAANAQVQLAWNTFPTATNYLLLRSTISGGPYSIVGSTATTNYIDATVVNGTTYYYVVSAFTPYTNSSDSSQASATPQAPAAVTWFKADAITGLGNGALLTNWLDSSGHGYNASQGTSGQQPTYVAGAMNGLPVVRFNSSQNTFLSFTRPVQDDFTMLIVFQSTQNNQGTGTAFYQGAGLVNGDLPAVQNDFGTALNANGEVIAGAGNPDTSTNSGNGYNDGQPHVVTFKRTMTSGAIGLYVDGTQAAAITGGTNSLTAPPSLDLGAVPSGGGFFSGDLAEVKIFDTALSDANRVVEENNLECKYGIGSVVASLGVPAGLEGVWGSRQVSLSWIGVSGATGYTLLSSTNASGPFSLLVTFAATSYLDTNAVVGRTNYYEVAAVNGCSTGPVSAAIEVFLPQPALNVSTPDGVSLVLTWPAWANNLNLYSATNLTPPVVWAAVTNSALSTNNEWIVTLPIDAGTGFYRLAFP